MVSLSVAVTFYDLFNLDVIAHSATLYGHFTSNYQLVMSVMEVSFFLSSILLQWETGIKLEIHDTACA